jgi:hypothetical protein
MREVVHELVLPFHQRLGIHKVIPADAARLN